MADLGAITPAGDDPHSETQHIHSSELPHFEAESSGYDEQPTAFVEEDSLPAEELRASALVLASGEQLGRKVDIPAEGMTIGRGSSCGLTVGSRKDGTSREHARVYFDGGELCLQDLNSTNGLRVNNEQLRFSRLRPGDLVQIGRTLLKVVAGGRDARYHEALYNKAVRDPLTGLFNRQNLDVVLANQARQAITRHLPLAIMMLDIDHFKKVNDTHGHQAGDAVLRQMAKLVRSGLRASDRAFRYGGEELLVMLPNTDLEHALSIAERLRRMAQSRRFAFEDAVIPITVSIGVAQLAGTVDDLIKRADDALYSAKKGGRNRVVGDVA